MFCSVFWSLVGWAWAWVWIWRLGLFWLPFCFCFSPRSIPIIWIWQGAQLLHTTGIFGESPIPRYWHYRVLQMSMLREMRERTDTMMMSH